MFTRKFVFTQSNRNIRFFRTELYRKSGVIISAKDIFYKSLERNNVSDAFIYSGGSIMPLIDSLYDKDINYYINSHEQNCGHALTGFSKSNVIHDKKAIVMTTSGPGFTNLITPMLDMTNDSTPGVFITGQVPLSAVGTNAFQEAPSVDLSKHVTKFSKQITNIFDLEYYIDLAFKIAYSGKMGAVHLDIPKCVASSKVDTGAYRFLKRNFNRKYDLRVSNSMINLLDRNNISYIHRVINTSKRPIIYLGQGCVEAYNLLREFAIKANIPVVSTIHGCGVFDEEHELSLQWCGMHGNAVANYAIQEADCIIALGSRFDDRTTGSITKYAPKCFESFKKGIGGIIHVNIESNEINKVVKSHYNYNMNCADWLNQVSQKVEFRERSDWINYITSLKHKHQFKFKTEKNKLYIENVLDKLYRKTKHFKDNIVFTTGVGNHQMQTYQYIKSHYPKKILSSGSLGVMGAGLPYAIGAKVANPEKMVIVIDGDSSFNMTLTDLKTVKENNIPIKIAIMNNDAQMMVTIWEKLFFEERYTATLNKRNPDFAMLAESYGIKSLKCDKIEDLDKTVDEFINCDEAILCEFKIEKDICLPLVGPGKALDDMVLPENYSSDKKFNKGMVPS